MINPAILSQRVHEKLEKACLTAIVTETFMKALPFDAEDVNAESKKYTSYVKAVMESLHCENMMKEAMKAQASNPSALNLLNKIQDAVDAAVIPATNRIVMEAAANPTTTLPKVVDKSAFTDAEKRSLMNKKGDISIDTISNIIKKKVVSTIKDEKEAYDAAQKLKDDIQDNLRDALGDNAPTTEAYMDIVLQKSDPRDYISFFSRLQDTCTESLMQMEDVWDAMDTETISLESLVNTTINSTLDCFDRSSLSVDSSIEILSKAVESMDEHHGDMEEHRHHCAKKAFLMAIIILTVMETLKTMHMWKPGMHDVRKFVDDPSNVGSPADNLQHKIHDEVMNSKKMMTNPETNRDGLSSALGAFNDMKAKLSAISEEILPNKEAILKEITEAASATEGCLVNKKEATESYTTDYYTEHVRDANIAEMDRVARMMFRNPNTKKVQIVCESDQPAKTASLTIRGLSDIGSITDKITACITMCPAFKDFVEELKTCCKFSKLGNYANQTEIHSPDKCRALSLNDPNCNPMA